MGTGVKTYTMSWAAAQEHKPEHPERTARRNAGTGLDFDVTFQVWPNRAAMARSIRMQEKRESRSSDWRVCVKLTETEGY